MRLRHHDRPPAFIADSRLLQEQFSVFLNPMAARMFDNAEPTAACVTGCLWRAGVAYARQCLFASHLFIGRVQFTHIPLTHSHRTVMLG